MTGRQVDVLLELLDEVRDSGSTLHGVLNKEQVEAILEALLALDRVLTGWERQRMIGKVFSKLGYSWALLCGELRTKLRKEKRRNARFRGRLRKEKRRNKKLLAKVRRERGRRN